LRTAQPQAWLRRASEGSASDELERAPQVLAINEGSASDELGASAAVLAINM